MRRHLTAILLTGVCALALAPALAADQGRAVETGNTPTQAAGDSGVALTAGQGVVRVDAAQKPALNLSNEQQKAVLDAVLQRDTFQPTPKEFKAAEDAPVPSKLDIHALPAPLINQIPVLKEYMYAHLDRNIVIVDATTKKVAALIALPPQAVRDGQTDDKNKSVKQAAEAVVGGLKDLSDEQRRAIYQAAGGEAQPVPQGDALRAHIQLPAAINTQPLPPEIAAQAPDLTGFATAKLQDGRVLIVDPQKHEIAGIITHDEGTKVANDEAGKSGANAGGNNMGSGGNSADPLREREETGKPGAYTGPSSKGN